MFDLWLKLFFLNHERKKYLSLNVLNVNQFNQNEYKISSAISVTQLNLLAVTHLYWGELCVDQSATGSAGATGFIPPTNRDYFPVWTTSADWGNRARQLS